MAKHEKDHKEKHEHLKMPGHHDKEHHKKDGHKDHKKHKAKKG